MRRLALLFAGCAVWLFLAAIPAFADGGPHVASVNNGSGGLTADSCAGCHRAHTAQNDVLLAQASTVDLCLSCHGALTTGATTNVENGVQYVPSGSATGPVRTWTVLGALRNGGFVSAAIGSDSGVRVAYTSGGEVRQLPKVPVQVDANGVISGTPATSTHFDVNNPEALVTAWGNGALGSASAGGTGNMDCATCHNPHGNGQYRILNPIPEMNGGTFTAATTGVNVADGPATTATRNYTVIQAVSGGANTTLLASQAAAYPNYAGDYFHRRVPWNVTASTTPPSYTNDQPNGDPTNFDNQINAWCAQCHTRYLSDGTGDTTDAIFHNRHFTGRNVVCTTCHVAHGSNAQMTGTYSANETYPGGAAAPVGDSRLLKLDNRGTCQACHDPTGTIVAGQQVGPTPNPLVP